MTASCAIEFIYLSYLIIQLLLDYVGCHQFSDVKSKADIINFVVIMYFNYSNNFLEYILMISFSKVFFKKCYRVFHQLHSYDPDYDDRMYNCFKTNYLPEEFYQIKTCILTSIGFISFILLEL